LIVRRKIIHLTISTSRGWWRIIVLLGIRQLAGRGWLFGGRYLLSRGFDFSIDVV
jgi:hypothetical protein